MKESGFGLLVDVPGGVKQQVLPGWESEVTQLYTERRRRELNATTLVPSEFPAIHSEVYSTENNGTLYLKSPGVVMIAGPAVNLMGMKKFLDGYPKDYKFDQYLDDPTRLSSVDQLIKAAGQVCYASFGQGRTYNEEVHGYLENLIDSGHGSVLEHPSYSLLLYGISRSNSHEIVRHRVGVAYSQLSQRFVSGRVLRFVERSEYQGDPELHGRFEKWIDSAADEYKSRTQILLDRQQKGQPIMSAEGKTDLRKKVQQASRSALPNETETVIVMTGNVRSWRNMIVARASEHAETEIRRTFVNIYQVLNTVAPNEFQDFNLVTLKDGTLAITTGHPKV